MQADNGAGLTRGVIGLANDCQPRRPDDWGVLRAWAWGASRVLDLIATEPGIEASRIGIEGVSRYGKAALVAMAFDNRFAMVLIGSSGEGGAKLHRRNFGEAVENLTAAGPVFRLLGASDLGTGDDYPHAILPAVNEGLLDGALAWRQHDGGHTDAPNIPHFIRWAEAVWSTLPQ